MEKKQKILSGLMAVAMMGSSAIPVFAADVASDGGKGTVPVELTAEATMFSVTVPTGLPVNVSAAGEVTVSPTNSIVNKSFGPIEVKSAKVTTANSWVLKDFGTDFTKAKVNAKEFGFQLNGENVGTDGNVAVTGFKTINGGESQNFTYDAKVAPQASEMTKQMANVVFTIGWDKDETSIPTKPHATGSAINTNKFRDTCQSLTGTITISREKYPGTDGVPLNDDNTVYAVVKGENATIYSKDGGGVLCPNSTSSMSSDGGLFYNLKVKELDLNGLDTSQVTDMQCMFYNCQSLTNINGLSNFNTSKVTDVIGMFRGCHAINNLDLSSFDTSNVTKTSGMFHSCRSLTTLDLSSFDTSNVTDMSDMFAYCHSLTTLDLSSFDTSKVTKGWKSMGYMFSDCNLLTEVTCRTETDANKLKDSFGCPETINFIVKGQ